MSLPEPTHDEHGHQHEDHEHDHDHTHDDHSHHHHDHEHEHHQHDDEGINWERVQMWVQTGIMFLLGLYFIDLALPGGDLGNYINVSNFGWLTWVAAFILLAIAGINTYDLLRQVEPDHHHNHDHEHQHAKAGSPASWFFLTVAAVPLVLGLSVPSKPLGANAVSDLSSDVRAIGFSGQPTAVEIAPEKRNMLDWVRAFAVSADLSEFEGQNAELVGFVYKDARFAGTNNFMVVRFTISCCVADARPLGLVVENSQGVDFDQDTWVKVVGKITIRTIDGVDTPVVITDSVEATTQPEQPYLYF